MKKIIILTLIVCSILSGCTKKDINNDGTEPEKYISFQDFTIKEICINMWDTNGDGKLSMKEAAAVKSIGNVFTGKKIYRFDELKYFTGITEIPAEAFYYDERTPRTGGGYYYTMFIKSITIPENVRKIGYKAISTDSDATITFKPATPPSIDQYSIASSGNSTTIGSNVIIYAPSSYKYAGGNWEYYYKNLH